MKKPLTYHIVFNSYNDELQAKRPGHIKGFCEVFNKSIGEWGRVVVIGDQQSNPPTLEFVDTSYTNSSGFTTVDMDQYFNTSGEENTTGYFDILVKSNNKEATDIQDVGLILHQWKRCLTIRKET